MQVAHILMASLVAADRASYVSTDGRHRATHPDRTVNGGIMHAGKCVNGDETQPPIIRPVRKKHERNTRA